MAITLELIAGTKKDYQNKYGKGTYATARYKGQLFGILTSSFEAGKVVFDEVANTVEITVDVVKRPAVPREDPMNPGKTLVGFPSLVQKVDIENEF